jgi:hypothetical protein
MLVIDPYIIRKSKKNYENADNSLIDSENNTVVNDESLLINIHLHPSPQIPDKRTIVMCQYERG